MSSNYSGSGEWIPEVRCWCGEIAPVRMSWSYANPGKRFRACPRYGVRGNGNCRYFQWLDSDVSDRVAKVIRGLSKRLDKQDSEMQRIQAVIEEKNVKLKKNNNGFNLSVWLIAIKSICSGMELCNGACEAVLYYYYGNAK
nr:uncharacterized protein LOC109168447 [Ipomoea trifida]